MLSNKQQLDSKYKDHALYNDKKFKDCRDCHIEPDWILIYKYLEEEIVLLLVNTGSHSEALKKQNLAIKSTCVAIFFMLIYAK